MGKLLPHESDRWRFVFFSSTVGIVYWVSNCLVYCLAWGNTDAKFAVWFFVNQDVDSQSVSWVTGLIIPSWQSLFSSSFTRSNFTTGPRRVGVRTGVTEGSKSICIGVPGGSPRPGLNTLAYCCKMSSAVSSPSGGGVCGVCRISSSTVFVSSKLIFKYSRACVFFPFQNWRFVTRDVHHKETFCL